MKTVAFYTLGCKVNQYDTEAMLELFKKEGYQVVDFDETADVYIINTCTVTNLGDRKSRQMIRKAHRQNPNAVVGVTGCYVQRAADEILEIPGVQLAVGTNNRNQIVQLVEEILESHQQINAVDNIMKTKDFENMNIEGSEEHTRAFLKIQEGCNQFCSYCIIPYVRGPIRSRNSHDIVNEVIRLRDAGFKEIVLTGIHLASYGRDMKKGSLLELVKEIHTIDGIERIRLGSIEPTLLTGLFIDEIAQLDKVCPHYHVSLQSGSTTVLKRMNRKYNPQEYQKYIMDLRSRIPRVSITTDIMVGFPGETESEFDETYHFVEELAFSKIHVFQYSPRQGTPAAGFKNQVDPLIKEDRSGRLIELGKKLERIYLESFLGTVQKVLFEEMVENRQNWMQGFTGHYIKVMAEGNNELQGQILSVKLDALKDMALSGKIFS